MGVRPGMAGWPSCARPPPGVLAHGRVLGTLPWTGVPLWPSTAGGQDSPHRTVLVRERLSLGPYPWVQCRGGGGSPCGFFAVWILALASRPAGVAVGKGMMIPRRVSIPQVPHNASLF